MKRILSHRSFFIGIFALLGIFLILFFPSSASRSAKNAAETWLRVILPTLLPFSVLSGIFVKSGAAQRLSKYAAPISRFFGFSDCFAYIFGMSLLSGYPIGAKLTSSMYEQHLLSDDETPLIVNATSTSGPGFLVSAVSLGMLGSAEYIPALLIPHILSAVIIAKLNGSVPHFSAASVSFIPHTRNISTIFSESIAESMNSMLVILGAMVLFSAVSAMVGILGISSAFMNALLSGILEFSSGCSAAALLPPHIALPLIAFISSFGGFSVILQTMAISSASKIPLRNFIPCKLLQGAFAMLISCFFFPSRRSFAFSASFVGFCLLFFFRKNKKQPSGLFKCTKKPSASK